MTIKRLLIANRGEIACRVMRTATALGIETVAVYSDVDKTARHVRMADQSVHIGPSNAADSYLSIDRIIDAARTTESDAIHPGYGFLSENAAFARACSEAGIRFVGPSEQAIALMGDKASAKRAMLAAGVPCIPGYQGEDQSDEILVSEAAAIGYPVMIKAAAGGGGRGMRLVEGPSALCDAIGTARSEALNAFGADELILEKAIINARHVEVQVMGDSHGTIVHLGERDCSVQRRHQKVIEEAPCPVLTSKLRDAMGQAAVAAARTVDYVGAGTVEFLLSEDGSFHFLEMNTRLQVEHPVTELVTGLDLVELQLRVAAGDPLGFDQGDVHLSGHAIEVRLYAEDSRNDFLPSTGTIEQWLPPAGDGIRVDTGVESGSDVSSFYDPMLAKIIASGATRDEARRRLVRALGASALVGPTTNRDFLIDALSRETFTAGNATTAFIAEEYGDAGFLAMPSLDDLAAAAVVHYELRASTAVTESLGVNAELLGWSSSARMESVFAYDHEGDPCRLTVRPVGNERRVVMGDEFDTSFEVLDRSADSITLQHRGRKRAVTFFEHHDGVTLSLATDALEFTVRDAAAGDGAADSGGSGTVTAPMHGLLLEVFVQPGDTVALGDRLALLEAMKMQHEILAEVDGTVAQIHVTTDTQVSLGDIIIEIDPAG